MNEFKRQVKEWSGRVGYREAVAALFRRGVSARLAEDICRGIYSKDLRPLTVEIIRIVMEETEPKKEQKA